MGYWRPDANRKGRGAYRSHGYGACTFGENCDRIKWLFDNDAYELPNAERPDCPKDGHTYPSVYGRMFWDKPAQIITAGFLTPGRGRNVHTNRPRVITPHEAARIQAFPDSFRFVVNGRDPARHAITKWIGDAVPSVLGSAAMLPLFTELKELQPIYDQTNVSTHFAAGFAA